MEGPSILSHLQCFLNIFQKFSKSSKILPGLGGFGLSPVFPPWPSRRASAPPRLPAAAAAAAAPPAARPAPGAAAAARAAPGTTSGARGGRWEQRRKIGISGSEIPPEAMTLIFYAILTLSYFYNPDQIRFIFDSVMCIVYRSQRPEQTEPVIFHSSMYTPYTPWQKPMLNRLCSHKKKKKR